MGGDPHRPRCLTGRDPSPAGLHHAPDPRPPQRRRPRHVALGLSLRARPPRRHALPRAAAHPLRLLRAHARAAPRRGALPAARRRKGRRRGRRRAHRPGRAPVRAGPLRARGRDAPPRAAGRRRLGVRVAPALRALPGQGAPQAGPARRGHGGPGGACCGGPARGGRGAWPDVEGDGPQGCRAAPVRGGVQRKAGHIQPSVGDGSGAGGFFSRGSTALGHGMVASGRSKGGVLIHLPSFSPQSGRSGSYIDAYTTQRRSIQACQQNIRNGELSWRDVYFFCFFAAPSVPSLLWRRLSPVSASGPSSPSSALSPSSLSHSPRTSDSSGEGNNSLHVPSRTFSSFPCSPTSYAVFMAERHTFRRCEKSNMGFGYVPLSSDDSPSPVTRTPAFFWSWIGAFHGSYMYLALRSLSSGTQRRIKSPFLSHFWPKEMGL